MTIISGTRFRLRSPLYLILVFWHSHWSSKQLSRADGFLGVKFLREANWSIFWSVTAWQNESCMNHYKNTGAHRQAMPWLSLMCNEASLVHWVQEDATIPDWQTVHKLMLEHGRFYNLPNPSKNHTKHYITLPQISNVYDIQKKDDTSY